MWPLAHTAPHQIIPSVIIICYSCPHLISYNYNHIYKHKSNDSNRLKSWIACVWICIEFIESWCESDELLHSIWQTDKKAIDSIFSGQISNIARTLRQSVVFFFIRLPFIFALNLRKCKFGIRNANDLPHGKHLWETTHLLMKHTKKKRSNLYLIPVHIPAMTVPLWRHMKTQHHSNVIRNANQILMTLGTEQLYSARYSFSASQPSYGRHIIVVYH